MPNGQYPVITAGQDPTASLLQAFAPLAAWKLGDTSRSNTVTPAADPDLTIPVAASAVYELSCYWRYEGGTLGSADFAWKWSVPTGANLYATIANQSTAGAATVGGDQTTNTVTAGSAGAGNVRGVTLTGTVTTSATTGSVTLLWSQGTLNATATILHAGSRFSLRRIA